MSSRSISLIPDAHLLLSSLRSVGYKIETAIADILDNSISKSATKINIFFIWNDEKSQIVIADNGSGMNQDELINSMKIGSADPKTFRGPDDLGRFGMGMKTAAFSLGKKLTVISKCENEIANACWDLEYIERIQSGEWSLIVDEDSSVGKKLIDDMKIVNTGTVILIENLDKLVPEKTNSKTKSNFYKSIAVVDKHLSLIFHRYIVEDGLEITINENPVIAWDPFSLNNSATQELGEENYFEDDKSVCIQPYVLPHKTKFKSEDDYLIAGGPKGWTAHQGFYVYRNRRLIIYGTWFDILKKEPAYNLARIKLDIDSKSDFDWKIDIKKSSATPPSCMHDLIERCLSICTETSAKVYNSRGTYSKSVASPHLGYVWEQRKNRVGSYTFHINKKHPLLVNLKEFLDEKRKKEIDAYLSLVENFAPFQQSGIIDHLQNDDYKSKASATEDLDRQTDLKEIKRFIKCFMETGYTKEEIQSVILGMANYRYLHKQIQDIFEGDSYD